MKITRQEIIEKGQRLVRTKGYHDTGISDILSTCDISKGTFYNYFQTKEEYLNEVLENYGIGMVSFISEHLTSQKLAPTERLRAMYLSLVEYNEKENCEKGCLLMNFAEEVGGRIDSISTRSARIYDQWLELVANCIKEGQENGEIITGKSSMELAELVHTSINGTLSIVKIRRSGEPMRRMLKTVLELIKT